MADYVDVPDEVLRNLRAIADGLPETEEQQAWAGTRWCVRRRTFAHVLSPDGPDGPVTVMTFRADEEELEILLAIGHPFFRAGWGTDVIGIVLGEATDWDEVAELLTESYCKLAPKKLVALVDRPEG